MQRTSGSVSDYIYQAIARTSDSNPYLHRVVRCGLSSPDDVDVSLYGKEINPRTEALLRSAEHEVLMQFYNFDHACEAGAGVLRSLIYLNNKASQNGQHIKFRLMVNLRRGPAAFFTRKIDNPFSWLKQDASGTYIEFEQEKHYLNNLDIKVKSHIHYFFDSYHAKQVIVDRKQLMLRSGDIDWPLNHLDGVRRRVEIATVTQSEAAAAKAAESFMHRWHDCQLKLTKMEYDASGECPVLLLEKNESTDPFKRLGPQAPYKIAVLSLIKLAKKSIDIMISNINDSEIVDEITTAIKRGVQVRLTTGMYMNVVKESRPGMGGTNQDSINRIYAAIPLRLWERFDVRWACDEESNHLMGADKCMHAKVIIMDGDVVIAGSSPMDKQAMYHSSECDILFESSEIATRFSDQVFNPVFNAGRSHNDYYLKALKFSLLKDIKNDLCGLTGLQAVFIESLQSSIASCGSISSLLQVVNLALDLSEFNPIVTVSGQGMFSGNDNYQKLGRIFTEHHLAKKAHN